MAKKLKLYDAFENLGAAKLAAGDLDNWFGKRKVRKLKTENRLKYGVFTERW